MPLLGATPILAGIIAGSLEGVIGRVRPAGVGKRHEVVLAHRIVLGDQILGYKLLRYLPQDQRYFQGAGGRNI